MRPRFTTGHSPRWAEPEAVTSPTELVDSVLGELGDARRRELLRRLDEQGTPLSTAELASQVGGDGTSATIELHHRHLPKLAQSGLVDYDPEAKRASVTERGRQAVVVLDRLGRDIA